MAKGEKRRRRDKERRGRRRRERRRGRRRGKGGGGEGEEEEEERREGEMKQRCKQQYKWRVRGLLTPWCALLILLKLSEKWFVSSEDRKENWC